MSWNYDIIQKLYLKEQLRQELSSEKPNRIICKNTVEGMQAGIIYGYVGQVEYIVRAMKR